MLLKGKKLLITGVLTPQSIAFSVAEHALAQGAEVLLTSFGRPMSLTQRTAKKLSPAPEVLELDVTNSAHFTALHDTIKQKWGRLDGILHAVAFAPEDALGGKFLTAPWESVQAAFRISTFSLKELSAALAPLMDQGGSILTLDFDNSTQAWPLYDWMGVCKAGLEAVVRYLARDLGPKKIRVNSINPGFVVTEGTEKAGISGSPQEEYLISVTPLGRSGQPEDIALPTAFLASDDARWITGEIIKVGGGAGM